MYRPRAGALAGVQRSGALTDARSYPPVGTGGMPGFSGAPVPGADLGKGFAAYLSVFTEPTFLAFLRRFVALLVAICFFLSRNART